jgi:hypothetical protein
MRNLTVSGLECSTANHAWTNPTGVPNEGMDYATCGCRLVLLFFWMNGPVVDLTSIAPATSDDFGFNEKAAFENSARNNKFSVDPMISSAVGTS